MNTTDPGSNSTFPSDTVSVSSSAMVTATTTVIAPTLLQPPSYSSGVHDPELTIMVVLGLSLLLAGLAAFLAVCRPSEQDEDSDTSCVPGEGLRRGGRSSSSEPQLKVWRRLGSYRRSYHLSFRRPPHRRPHERGSSRAAEATTPQTVQPEAGVEPHLTTPCLFDYVTEI